MLGDIGRLQEAKKDLQNKMLSEMSKSELDAEIAKIARKPDVIPVSERRPKPKTLKASKRKRIKRTKPNKRQRTTSGELKQYDF